MMLPETLGPYRIERRLAGGGMAEVFVARRQGAHGFQKQVALKRILPQHARDPEFVGMFIDEARLAARLAHPNIVQVFDFGEATNSLFMAMELVEGTTVGRLLRTVASHRETVPLGAALHVARQAADALSYAHRLRDDSGEPLSIVHRDVSPANLLLDAGGHLKLTDFGIARCRTSEERTDDGHIRGKLGYMSPEQVIGDQIDGKSDVFTMAIVLTELLIAEPLFGHGEDLDILMQIRNADLTVLRRAGKHLPGDVVHLLEWALQKDRRKRPTAGELFSVLDEVIQRRSERAGGALELARLLERLELVPRSEGDILAREAGARPTFLVEVDEAVAPVATESTKSLLESIALDEPQTYELRSADGRLEGPLPYAEIVRRIVTGQLGPGAKIRRDQGDFESAGRMPELRRYVDSAALGWGQGGGPPAQAVRRGVLYGGRLLAQAHELVARRETGSLHLWDGARRKKIFFVDGKPDYVASNIPNELLGEVLVTRGHLLRMELEMALALLPRYDGRLGDALVGLGMMRPMELFRAVAEQVRGRYLEAFRWDRGQWAYVRGERCREETIPMGQGEHELLRDVAMEAEAAQVEAVLRPLRGRRLSHSPSPLSPSSAFRLPKPWERVLTEADGRTVEQLERNAGRAGLPAGDELRRALYLGLSCDLLRAA